MRRATAIIARLTVTRLRRGRSLWLAVGLTAVPVLMALAQLADRQEFEDPEAFQKTTEVALRFMAALAPTILLCNALGEELEARTYTYLWSRPFPRAALLLGKAAVVAPLCLGLAAVSILPGWFLLAHGRLDWLANAYAGILSATVASSAMALGIGALFPRHPFIFAIGYFGAEQLISLIPNVAKLSIVYHARSLAGQPVIGAEHESRLAALVALVILTAAWLGAALWRVGRAELAPKDG